ncbi:MAG: class I SAM-dependent methyltransferase [Pseudomonadales bacterium]|nr:class I SAM-dependent methyltransferase [Pseudomonadales bacterium]
MSTAETHDDPHAIFFAAHTDLPREAPGGDEWTLRALSLVPSLPPSPRVLDIGCGPGAQTLVLARAIPDARITAVDAHLPYLEDLRARARQEAVSGQVQAYQADMRALPFESGNFDLLWCEAAVYIMGFGEALRAWRHLLTPAGTLVLSELVWLRDDRPQEVTQFWTEYPAMTTIPRCLGMAEEAGYRCVGNFVMPQAAWWDAYYTPLRARIQALRERFPDSPRAQATLDDCQAETDLYERWPTHYGYAFFVFQRATETNEV